MQESQLNQTSPEEQFKRFKEELNQMSELERLSADAPLVPTI